MTAARTARVSRQAGSFTFSKTNVPEYAAYLSALTAGVSSWDRNGQKRTSKSTVKRRPRCPKKYPKAGSAMLA
jgi:hypothetical protein